MTEDEARELWCPFARARADLFPDSKSEEPPFAVNRKQDGAPDHWCLCLASGCMAWRWYERAAHDGYCGLAGKPN